MNLLDRDSIINGYDGVLKNFIVYYDVHPAKPTDPPARVKVVQPKNTTPPRITHLPAPTPPVVPQHVEQPIPKHVPVQPIHVNPPQPKGQDKGKAKGSVQLHGEMFPATEAVDGRE
jgi:hypothetical protein